MEAEVVILTTIITIEMIIKTNEIKSITINLTTKMPEMAIIKTIKMVVVL